MPARSEPRQHQESPVRIFGMDDKGQAINLSAWTVDISHHGARIRGVTNWSTPGETIGVRHGAEKARYKIVWVGTNGAPTQGQIGLMCVEAGKYIWGVAAPESSKSAAAANASGAIRPGNITSKFHALDETRMPIGLMPNQPPPQRAKGGLAGDPGAVTNNRRKDARYIASGGAKITEIGATAPQWATLHDLSLGGCYVETTAPLLPGARVEMVLHIDDIQIATKGMVTVQHKLVGMGVKFTELSPLNRTRLEQVMTTLTETSAEA